ncbi:unnamed protein product [Linum trigynum]
MSNPNDWANHFYHHHNQLNFSSDGNITAVTTASTITSSAAAEPTPIQLAGSNRWGGHNSVANSSSTLSRLEGGRVSKPARKRSRASRRTPTTLLSTDTSNFRAMVQQFTGGPAGPFVTGGLGSSLNVPSLNGFSFGLEQHRHPFDRMSNNAAQPPPVATGGGGGGGGGGEGLFHQLQYQESSQFHQSSPFLFSLANGSNSDENANIDGVNSDLLLQRGIGTEGGAAPTEAAPPSAGSNENRNSGFMY